MTNEPITDAQLAEWEAAANAATPAPWFNDSAPPGPCGAVSYANAILSASGERVAERPMYEDRGITFQDLAFIASTRTAVPALIAEVRRLRKERYDLLNVRTKEGMLASEWLSRTATAEAEVRRLRAELKKARSNPSLDQALNEGDGTYRP